MKIKTVTKPSLQRLLKTKHLTKRLQTADNKEFIQEQNCSGTHLKEIEKDVNHKQHRATANTQNFHSPSQSSNLNLRTQRTNRIHNTDFDTPTPLTPDNFSDNLSSLQVHAVSRKPPEFPTAHQQYYFSTDVQNIRTLPKDLLFSLQPGNEIQWAQITLATLEEFPFINDKLKLNSLMHQMTNHNIAYKAASAQILQAIQDPTHNPLHAFFNWLKQSYSLTKQEQNTRLRKAINEQKIDWCNKPAIDLQNAITQAHTNQAEINDNEIFSDTLRDALKHKLQPYYYLIADSNITDLPDKLCHIWKNIAIPQPNTRKVTETDQSIRSKTISTTDVHQQTNQLNTVHQTPHPHLDKQIHSLSRIVTKRKNVQSQRYRLRPFRLQRLQTRTCFRCHNRGHLVKDCRQHLRGYPY